MYVYSQDNYFKQSSLLNTNKVISIGIINIYCVYKLDPIASSRDTSFTIQDALFGAMQITKNADTSKYKYKGYGICFDEGGLFSIGNINNGRNVLIFEVHEDSVMQIIKQITYLLWVMALCKELMTLYYMQKKFAVKTLLNLVQNLYLICIIMVMIVIYLLTVDKN